MIISVYKVWPSKEILRKYGVINPLRGELWGKYSCQYKAVQFGTFMSSDPSETMAPATETERKEAETRWKTRVKKLPVTK